ncbi:capsular biosynthesis protein [Methylobacterium sp. WCS2018Hpa-22]|uniref:capsular polysaccharide export protein, LipB/KpsS family n=1 Tax=Methylobacterium sp. WCS2018Hpa-22 TaxID=3073633 RepID=UPI0038621732
MPELSPPFPPAASSVPRPLLATSRPIRALRAEIESVTGRAFAQAWAPGAIGVIWGRRGLAGRCLQMAGRRLLTVEPGPLLSPYDSPERGLSSLRFTLDGVPFGGEAGIHAFDPWTRQPITLDECRDRVAWLERRFRDNDSLTVLVGISRWKRPALDVFVGGPAGKPVYAMNAEEAVAKARSRGQAGKARILAWATRMPAHLPSLSAEHGIPLARIEDGFLRSVGLGASLQPGASIVVDDSGIYYDPRTESRLARILKNEDFSPELVARASLLRRLVVERRLTKYNVGLAGDASGWPEDRRIVLVPGQVEDDASVRHGSPHVRSNLELLRAARSRNPGAFLLYKPHPDVEAGFRPGAIPEAEVLALADRIVAGLSIVDLLDRAHHVETMTSLAGFEALIRGLSVAVHGQPFYAGWGLTEDLAPGADRGRRLALDELVAGALLVYPLYLDPVAMKPCTPEQLLERLSQSREAAAPSKLALSRRAQTVMRLRYAVLNPIVRLIRARRGIGRGGDK